MHDEYDHEEHELARTRFEPRLDGWLVVKEDGAWTAVEVTEEALRDDKRETGGWYCHKGSAVAAADTLNHSTRGRPCCTE